MDDSSTNPLNAEESPGNLAGSEDSASPDSDSIADLDRQRGEFGITDAKEARASNVIIDDLPPRSDEALAFEADDVNGFVSCLLVDRLLVLRSWDVALLDSAVWAIHKDLRFRDKSFKAVRLWRRALANLQVEDVALEPVGTPTENRDSVYVVYAHTGETGRFLESLPDDDIVLRDLQRDLQTRQRWLLVLTTPGQLGTTKLRTTDVDYVGPSLRSMFPRNYKEFAAAVHDQQQRRLWGNSDFEAYRLFCEAMQSNPDDLAREIEKRNTWTEPDQVDAERQRQSAAHVEVDDSDILQTASVFTAAFLGGLLPQDYQTVVLHLACAQDTDEAPELARQWRRRRTAILRDSGIRQAPRVAFWRASEADSVRRRFPTRAGMTFEDFERDILAPEFLASVSDEVQDAISAFCGGVWRKNSEVARQKLRSLLDAAPAGNRSRFLDLVAAITAHLMTHGVAVSEKLIEDLLCTGRPQQALELIRVQRRAAAAVAVVLPLLRQVIEKSRADQTTLEAAHQIIALMARSTVSCDEVIAAIEPWIGGSQPALSSAASFAVLTMLCHSIAFSDANQRPFVDLLGDDVSRATLAIRLTIGSDANIAAPPGNPRVLARLWLLTRDVVTAIGPQGPSPALLGALSLWDRAFGVYPASLAVGGLFMTEMELSSSPATRDLARAVLDNVADTRRHQLLALLTTIADAARNMLNVRLTNREGGQNLDETWTERLEQVRRAAVAVQHSVSKPVTRRAGRTLFNV